MATIERREGKRGVSYKIVVTDGKDENGKPRRFFKTWRPEKGMTQRQIEREVTRAAVAFENDILYGFQLDNKQTFAEYAEYFVNLKFDMGMITRSTFNLNKSTCELYINPYIGRMRLQDIKPQHLNTLYKKLMEPGQKVKDKYAVAKPEFFDEVTKSGIPQRQIMAHCGISDGTITKLKHGDRARIPTAEKLSAFFGKPLDELFTITGEGERLSTSFVKRIVSLVKSVFAQAEKELIVKYNPAKRATLPPAAGICKRNYLQPEQLRQVLQALEQEPLKWQTLVYMLIVTGCRRGELLALRWQDIDTEQMQIVIKSSINTDAETGKVYEGQSTKTKQIRTIPIDGETVARLQKYRKWQLEYRLKVGDLWQDTGFVFTAQYGGMLRPGGVNQWLLAFAKRHGLPHLNPHCFRHTAATLMISQGADVVTVSSLLGHSSTTTTLNTYAHAVESNKRAAVENITDVLQGRG